jgi:ABC-2 type transport system permease protein
MSTDQRGAPPVVDSATAAATAADIPADPGPEPAADARPPGPLGPVPSWLRFFTSELRLVFFRPRNVALLGVLAVVPVFFGVVLRLTLNAPSGGTFGPQFLNQLAGNGVFLALVVLSLTESLLLLPLAMAVVTGEAIAGEASVGTLRGLLTVPAGRTRLLAVKYASILVFSVASCLLVTALSLIVGLVLFHTGPVTLLSGTTVSLGSGVLRVCAVAAYTSVAMMSLGAIGLAASTLTTHQVGAIAGLMVLVVASEICDQLPELSAIHAYLPTHWWLSWDGLFRSPMDTSGVATGMVSFAVYAAIFLSIAWARLASADVTS